MESEYKKLGTTAGYDDWHEGDPAGLRPRIPSWRRGSIRSWRQAAGQYLSVLTLEAQTIARACGKSTCTIWSRKTLWR